MNSHRKKLKQKYPDCWQWISMAKRFSGELTEDEAISLFQLARFRTPSTDPVIVELGGRQGKTSLLLAAGLRGKTRPRLRWVQGSGAHGDSFGDPDERSFHRNIQRCGLGHIVDTTVGRSPDAATSWTDGIDILFVNTSADSDALHRDLVVWSPFVKLNGIVVLQDASTDSLPLTRAIAEHLRAPRYADMRQVDRLTWATATTSDFNANTEVERFGGMQDYARRSRKELAENRRAIHALRRSWSWRLTGPLRLGMETWHVITGFLRSLGRGSPKARIVGLVHWMLFGRQVRASGLLDERYYGDNHSGLAWAQTSPLLHFFVCGASEGNKPNELFDVHYYLGRYPDVARSGVNPLLHYLRDGAYEGRDPHPHFDSSFYLEQNPDVREAHLNPLAHYLAPGIAEGRDPNPWFDTSEYLEQNPDIVDFALNPLAHQEWSNRQPCSR